MQGAIVVLPWNRCVGTVLEEQAHEAYITLFARQMKRSPFVSVELVDIHTTNEKASAFIGVTPFYCGM